MRTTLPDYKSYLDRLGLFIWHERMLLLSILTYAVAVGIFSLIIPLTVQELVNTFAFTVSPVMLATIIGIMAIILFFVGAFRILQFYATDILERRLFVRVTLALAQIVSRVKGETFQSDSINRFFETVFLQRALSGLLVDFTNVLVGGLIGMALLVLYHPYFIVFDLMLLGSVVLIGILGKGGVHTTLHMSEAKYNVFRWLQEVTSDRARFNAATGIDLMGQADALARVYVRTRESRFGILLRQYIGWLALQVFLQTGLLGTAGWLLSQGELTLGQLVAAEVIVASLLVNLESVIKRTYVVFYFFSALTELDALFSLPDDAMADVSDSAALMPGMPGESHGEALPER